MIEVKNLSAGYPDRTVLENADLTLRPGEVVALLGPNGCGKTTLLRTLLGLQPPLGGDILLDGLPLTALSPKERARRMAWLPQSRAVPNITAFRMVLHGRFPHLDYPRKYRPEDYEAVARSMERAGVADLAHRPLSQLSGGQRQRVYLAMALAQETPYVFFDEPTTYLDAAHQLETMGTALDLAAQGKGVVLVLHDLTLALRTAHKIVILDGGRVKAVGTAEEVFQSGVLQTVFGIKISRLQTQNGWRYYYE